MEAKENKKIKITNSMLVKLREQVRPEIIENLQESFSHVGLKNNQ